MIAVVRRFAPVLAGMVFVAFLWFFHPLDTRAATITVTTATDEITPSNGTVSLREAITAINAGNDLGDADITSQNPTATDPFHTNDTINFNITGTGAIKIALSSSGLGALPTLSFGMKIDGATEPGYPANNIVVDGGCPVDGQSKCTGAGVGSVFTVRSQLASA